ncbi:MAG: hypothetical protein EP349_08200 [Alphaproteobacteria bacterium]|nr:MAG: hypothetical protein EP349_08200 [Alphaproteobacteria bacterium]
MAKPVDSFFEAFDKAAKRSESFGAGHKTQLDALADIVAEINTGDVFSAEIKGMSEQVPVLRITQKSDGNGQTFFIGFGYDAFGGSETLLLSTGMDKKPLGGKEDGYSLQYDNEREDFLKKLGEKTAQKCAKLAMGAASVKYAGSRKTAK